MLVSKCLVIISSCRWWQNLVLWWCWFYRQDMICRNYEDNNAMAKIWWISLVGLLSFSPMLLLPGLNPWLSSTWGLCYLLSSHRSSIHLPVHCTQCKCFCSDERASCDEGAQEPHSSEVGQSPREGPPEIQQLPGEGLPSWAEQSSSGASGLLLLLLFIASSWLLPTRESH